MNRLEQKTSLRKSAMYWWISTKQQEKFLFTKAHYPGRNWYSLNGKEIQHIYITDPKSSYAEDQLYEGLNIVKSHRV